MKVAKKDNCTRVLLEESPANLLRCCSRAEQKKHAWSSNHRYGTLMPLGQLSPGREWHSSTGEQGCVLARDIVLAWITKSMLWSVMCQCTFNEQGKLLSGSCDVSSSKLEILLTEGMCKGMFVST